VKWCRRSAEQGWAEAQYILGALYVQGKVVPQNYVQAHKWLNLAASGFPASDQEGREKAIQLRDSLAAKMTPAQVAEAQRLAQEWKPKPEQ
jgi:TPR repeat protein